MQHYLAHATMFLSTLLLAGAASAAKVPAKPAAKAAPAATAGIRVACDGDNDAAMVNINGVFKGQCPVDIQIPPGVIKLKAYQKIDAGRERAFFIEFTMAEHTLKKVEVKLGPPLTPSEMVEYERSAPERARAAALAQEQARTAEADKLLAAEAEKDKLQNSWRKVTGRWSDVGTPHDEGCMRLQDHMHRYIKQERHFRCACEDEISNHPAHRGNTFTSCEATWEANLVINGVNRFGKSWDGPHRGDGTGERFSFGE